MKSSRKIGMLAFGAAVVGVVSAAGAWACIAGPTLDVNPRSAKPGAEVTLQGASYNRNPAQVRLDALDGPVVATLQPEGGTGATSNYSIKGTFAIPASTKPGTHVIIVTQSDPAKGGLSQVPTRAALTVVGDGGTPVLGAPAEPVSADRPEGLIRGESVSTGAKVLVGLGAAGVALFLAGLATVVSSRRPSPAPEAARVGS